MASTRKPNQSDIDTATYIRQQVRRAAEKRDFEIKEAHRQYANHFHWQRRSPCGEDMRDWFAGVRKKIYRQLKPKYPNLTAEDWKLLYKLMGAHISTESLMRNGLTGRITIHAALLGSVDVYSLVSDEVTSVIPECAHMIIKAFKMARIMCAGVLTIRVHHQKRYHCVIRVR